MLARFQIDFITEIWTEYSVCVVLLLLRTYTRWKTTGVRSFSWDDLFFALSVALLTAGVAALQIAITHGSFVGLDEVTAQEVPAALIEQLEVGSKALIWAWFAYVSIIWALKGSVLGYYNRLAAGTPEQRLVKAMAVICFFSWLAMMFLVAFRCRPFQKNWQIVPYAGDECTYPRPSLIATMVLNIWNDIGLLIIPGRLLHRAQIPLRRKIAIGLLLSSSVFIIICAVLRCIIGLEAITNTVLTAAWGAREALVTYVVISLPVIKPLFSRYFKKAAGLSYGSATRSWHTSTPHGKPIQLQETTASVRDMDGFSMGSSNDLIEPYGSSKPHLDVEYGINVQTDISVETDHSSFTTDTHGPWPRPLTTRVLGGSIPGEERRGS